MSTTWIDLIAQPNTHKVTLAEITVGEQISPATQVSGNTYKITGYLYESIALTNGLVSKLPKIITAMIADGVSLSAQTNLTNVQNVNNSFWHDTANQILHVHTGDGGGTAAPNLTTAMMAYFTLCFGTEGRNLNGRYYEPYISSAPSVSQSSQNLLSGYVTIGVGVITFANADGFFDVISSKYFWENGAVTILIGGGDSGYPYSEFQKVFVGKVYQRPAWNLQSFSLDLRDAIQDLLRQLPEQLFTTGGAAPMTSSAVVAAGSGYAVGDILTVLGGIGGTVSVASVNANSGVTGLTVQTQGLNYTAGTFGTSGGTGSGCTIAVTINYPNMNPNLIGKPIPIAYGAFDVYSAPDVTAIDEVLAANCVRFKIAQHEITSIEGVYISTDNGNTYGAALTLSGTAFPSAPAEGANYYNKALGGGTPAEIIVNFGAGVYDNKKVRVKVAFHGKPETPGSNVTMSTGADIVQDLLINYNYFSAANLKASSFAASDLYATAPLNLYLDKTARTADVINRICTSNFAYFFVDGAGLLNFTAWQPGSIAGITTTLDGSALLEIFAKYDVQNQFTSLQIGYGHTPNSGNKYAYAISTQMMNLYQKRSLKSVDTYVTNYADAALMATRLNRLQQQPLEILTVKATWAAASLNVGDRVQVTLNRGTDSSGAFDRRIFEVIGATRDFTAGTVGLTLANWFAPTLGVAWITPNDYPAWPSASQYYRSRSGYVCDDYGYAYTGDLSSYMASLIQ